MEPISAADDKQIPIEPEDRSVDGNGKQRIGFLAARALVALASFCNLVGWESI
jgi:hypothetical protein